MSTDWLALRRAATEVMRQAYAPYSKFPVGAAALVDDGRVVVGCNVENASYGLTLCAECAVVSALHTSGGGRLVALSCVDGAGELLMPCGRCRQLLWEHGGPDCLVDADPAPLRMSELLPHAFGSADLDAARDQAPDPPPSRLVTWRGRGTVFVHLDMAGGQRVWTGYWERSAGFGEQPEPDERPAAGILEEAPTWPDAADAVAWGRARTPRVVVIDADGATLWAGEPPAPPEIPTRWTAQQ